MTTEKQIRILLWLFVVICVIAVLIMKFIKSLYFPFVMERDFLRMEIGRNRGREKRRWERELKWFYMSHIPIIGTFLAWESKKRYNRKKRRKI